ncbi:MAG: UDP-3-O-acyl-N-acetylglucosamine deacetylase [candidate division WOR-3 bacterium]
MSGETLKYCGATIARPVTRCGVDRSGRPAQVTLRPAGPGSGIWFVRNTASRTRAWPVSVRHRAEAGWQPCDWTQAVRATVGNAVTRGYETCLGQGIRTVRMVEHLLAACYGLGVTDLLVETSGSRLPLLDGSAQPYVTAMMQAGMVRYQVGPRTAHLRRPLLVQSGTRFIAAFPASRLTINCFVQLPRIGPQYVSFVETAGAFVRDIARARTFGWVDLPSARQRLGLRFGLRKVTGRGQHGAFVYPARWRLTCEPCRHKVLDLVGDLALLGRPVGAELFAFRPGHDINLEFVRKLERALKE